MKLRDAGRTNRNTRKLRAACVAVFYAAVLSLSLMPDKPAWAVLPQVKGATLMPQDQAFLAAAQSYERRDLKALAAHRDAWRKADHVLAAYPEYWYLAAALQPAQSNALNEADAIQRFLARHADSPLADALRREWLKALCRQSKWETFLAEVPRVNSDDAEIICHHLRARVERQDRAAVSEARALWNTATPLPEACYELFGDARATFGIGATEQWQRVRKLLEENQMADARRSAALIEGVPAFFERQTASIGIRPGTWLQKESLNPKSRASIELFLFAITRMARSDAADAAMLLERHGKGLPEAERREAFARIGLHGAVQHDERALDWFKRAEPMALNSTQSAWKVRAALRQADWTAVKSTIAAMDSRDRRDPAWRYWLARAESALGNAPAAGELRAALARETGFYGLLAAEESGIAVEPIWKSWKPNTQDIANFAARPGIARALALYRLDMRNEGLREWQAATREFDDQTLLTAAEVARTHNVPDRAISVANRTLALHDFTQRYPMPHREALAPQAKNWGLDEAWVYGLIRQESRFMADAKSRVGAAGLMQLMPATARWAATRVGIAPQMAKNLTDVPVNLALGTFYLKHVLDDLGHPVLATAAYNAGPGRARRWRADAALEGAIYAETIPFNETRDYVKNVMANTWYYARQNGNTKVRLTDLMGRVPGKRGSEGDASSVGLVTVAEVR
ncbi:MAG: lytic transglycosylase domain-containing protein [Betaproteobacteria bacterium]|nr:lytic transglycosylase domain-containing protein [Betaproteobacteria bacterium]